MSQACASCPHRSENAKKVYLAHGEFPQTGEAIDRNWSDEPHCCHEALPKRTPCRGQAVSLVQRFLNGEVHDGA